MPLFNDPNDVLILKLIPPPQLQLLLGAVNFILSKLGERWGTDNVENWLKLCGLTRTDYRNQELNGNNCRKLLKACSLRFLKSSIPIDLYPFAAAFEALDLVVSGCFGHKLSPNYDQLISRFKSKYLDLQISVTPKLHMIFCHLTEFIDQQLEAGEGFRGLGIYSEQAFEAAHSDFLKIWQNFAVDPQISTFPTKLLRAQCMYNCLNM